MVSSGNFTMFVQVSRCVGSWRSYKMKYTCMRMKCCLLSWRTNLELRKHGSHSIFWIFRSLITSTYSVKFTTLLWTFMNTLDPSYTKYLAQEYTLYHLHANIFSSQRTCGQEVTRPRALHYYCPEVPRDFTSFPTNIFRWRHHYAMQS